MKAINILLFILSRIIPVRKNMIVFHSFPDCTDNSFALYKYILINRKNEYRLIWLIQNPERKPEVQRLLSEIDPKTMCINKRSVLGVYYFLRAHYVFTTHGVIEGVNIKRNNRILVNLWHGMPLKKIGRLDNNSTGYEEKNIDYTVVNSELFQQIMADSFGIRMDQVLVTGQPRCDMLYETTDYFSNHKINRSSYNRVGIWMPTYRTSIIGDIRKDGKFNEGMISFCNEDDLDILNQQLSHINDLLLIKLHPMDVLQNYSFKQYSNIRFIYQRTFKEQLYPLLGACNYLLTDYSSVFFDYEILNKPIGFVINDLSEYSNNRGFCFNNLEEFLPGPMISSLEQLIAFIKKPYITQSPYVFNKYHDNRSCERLVNYLKM